MPTALGMLVSHLKFELTPEARAHCCYFATAPDCVYLGLTILCQAVSHIMHREHLQARAFTKDYAWALLGARFIGCCMP